jgi:hypothetical protein
VSGQGCSPNFSTHRRQTAHAAHGRKVPTSPEQPACLGFSDGASCTLPLKVTSLPAWRRSRTSALGTIQYTSRVLYPGLQLNPVLYKGFTITARTFQIRGSGRWTLDLLIGRHTDLRAFSGPRTYPTEESANTGCCEFGQRIIDGRVRNCSVDDLL